MESVALACDAMATRFEIVLHGRSASGLRGAAEEALREVERLEDRLSLYRPSSEIARVNAGAANAPVRVSPAVFSLLQHAARLTKETGGSFDITIAPLVRCWGFMGGTGAMPDPAELAKVRECVGMKHVQLDEDNLTVQFDQAGVMLDLGAIGKGYAVDQAVLLLREAGVTCGLIHGGTSTVYGLGLSPEGEPWKIAVESPRGAASPWTATISLEDEALSVSAVWGRSFEKDGKTLGHVIDPASGQPVSGAALSAVTLPSATESDALSTALLVRGLEDFREIVSLRPGAGALVSDFNGHHQAFGRCTHADRRETIEKPPRKG